MYSYFIFSSRFRPYNNFYKSTRSAEVRFYVNFNTRCLKMNRIPAIVLTACCQFVSRSARFAFLLNVLNVTFSGKLLLKFNGFSPDGFESVNKLCINRQTNVRKKTPYIME